jgi:cytosine/adenosine deaminase-related metal-dependent hydrolase
VATPFLPGAEWSLTARWIFPIDGAPLERGCIVVSGESIVAVETQGRRKADMDLGNVAVLPGLVNAHTHLDLGGLKGLAPPSADFTGWLRAVIAHRRMRSAAQVTADVQAGLEESLASGTTLLADISGQGLSWPVLANASLRSVVFFELLGLPEDRAALACEAGLAWLEAHSATRTCRPGLSPHAPYSVRASLFQSAAQIARCRKLPLASHLAETPAELTLLRSHEGPFVSFLSGLGVWEPTGLVDSVEEVLEQCRDVPHAVFAHANYLRPTDQLAPRGSVVYCPRTHAAFGHPAHPFRQFLARGVRVALGTDSLASNPDLSVLNEARFLHRHNPDVPGDVLLRLATLAGAEALGWQDETGSLTPGKSADLVVLPLPPEDEHEPHRLVLASDLPLRAVLCRGQWLGAAPGYLP